MFLMHDQIDGHSHMSLADWKVKEEAIRHPEKQRNERVRPFGERGEFPVPQKVLSICN